MGFFVKSDQKCDDNSTTIITKGTKIKGEIEQSCKMHIDGIFEGILKSASEVTVDKNGHIVGEIFADKVIVSGKIDGKVKAQTIDILAGGMVSGEVETQNLIIEPNGFFEGQSKILKDKLNEKLEDKKVDSK